MSDIPIQIDGRAVAAKAGMTVLEAARAAGFAIPTLCHHERLEPFGACRVCIVEAEQRGQKRLVAACTHPVEEGLAVTTRSEKIDRIRKSILEMLLAHAPDSPPLQALAREYGADRDRFEKDASFCIHCGLCVRYCAEIKKANAVGFVDRGTGKEVSFLPEIAARECNRCKECFPLCPTSYLQAAFVLCEALAFPAAASASAVAGSGTASASAAMASGTASASAAMASGTATSTACLSAGSGAVGSASPASASAGPTSAG